MVRFGVAAALFLWCVLAGVAWLRFGLPVLALAVPATPIVAGLAWLVLRTGQREAALRSALNKEAGCRNAGDMALRRDRRMASIGRLTRGLAHDFNNHLTVVNSNIELLARRLPPDAERLTGLAEAALDGVRRAASLTHHLASLSRDQPFDPEPLDLGRLVRAMADLLRRALGKGITVETSLADGLWLAWADAHQVEWCLLEMALNAADAMPEGGTLTIATANSGAASGAGMAGVTTEPLDCVTLEVSDTRGGDVDAAADWTGESVTGCQVRLSRQSEGLTARLYLPRYRIQTLAAGYAVPADAGPGRPPTILLVEDDEDIRSATATTLREMGYRVLEAPDAMEGFRLLVDRGGIDLLFTDIGLPAGVDGRALADAVRNLVPELRILFTTGGTPVDCTREWGERGMLFLPKPFTHDQLADKIREALPVPAVTPELAAGAA